MTIAFHSFNYTSHVFNSINFKHGNRYTTRVNPALAIPPSSIFFRTDESRNSQGSKKINLHGGTLLKNDATIGIIGGISINSTFNFLNKLVELSMEDEQSCPPFVLCSDPVLGNEILPFCPSSYAIKSDGFKINHAPIVENLRRKRGFLENSGAGCIVMPCHILHSWYAEVSCGCSVPILHVGECVARELKEAKLKPIETGYPPRIGVLATSTLVADFYQDKLRDEGFEVVLPDKATMEHTIIPAIEALNNKDMEGAQTLLRIALQVLLVRAVNLVVLGSEEMRGLLPRDDPLLKKCIDPMDALARSTIKWARSAEKH